MKSKKKKKNLPQPTVILTDFGIFIPDDLI